MGNDTDQFLICSVCICQNNKNKNGVTSILVGQWWSWWKICWSASNTPMICIWRGSKSGTLTGNRNFSDVSNHQKVTEVIVLRRDDAIMQGGRLLQAIQAYKKVVNMRCRGKPYCLMPNIIWIAIWMIACYSELNQLYYCTIVQFHYCTIIGGQWRPMP